MKTLNIVFPMAGQGQRFKDAGWNKPKPLYPVLGVPMIAMVTLDILSYFASTNLYIRPIFIIREDQFDEVVAEIEYRFTGFEMWDNINGDTLQPVYLPTRPTRGAVQTVLVGADVYGNGGLLTVNCDQLIDWSDCTFKEDIESCLTNNTCDGVIQTLTVYNDPSYSYVTLDSSGYVKEVREKRPISHMATTGLYFWTNAQDFVTAGSWMVQMDIREGGEFYIAPSYNILIGKGKKFITSNVKGMDNLGTPEGVKLYEDTHNQRI